MSGFKLTNTGSASTSKGIDFSGIELSSFHDIKISNANQSLYATGTLADYNNFTNIVSAPLGTSGNNTLKDGGRANFNTFINIRSIDTASTTAYDFWGRNNDCINCESETGAATAFHLESTSFGTVFVDSYSESDVIGWQFESGSKATTILGGYTHDTTNIVNNGGSFSFVNNYLNNMPFSYNLEVSSTPQYAWLTPYQYNIPTSNDTSTVGTIIGLEVNNPTDGFTKGLEWVNGVNVNASYTVGLYGPLVAADTFASSSLLVTATGTTNSTANTPVNIQWPSLTFMPAGLYFEVIEFASTSQSYLRQSNQSVSPGWCGSNTNGGVYTALPTSGPAFTATGSNCPFITTQMAVASGTY
jgi:hypothetical protein